MTVFVMGNSHAFAIKQGKTKLEATSDGVSVFLLGSGVHETKPFSELRAGRVVFREPAFARNFESATSETSIDHTHTVGLVMGTHNSRILRGSTWKEATPSDLDYPERRPISKGVLDAIIDSDQKYIKTFIGELIETGAKVFVISCPPIRRDGNIVKMGLPLDIIQAVDRRARQRFTDWLDERSIPFITPPDVTMDEQGFLKKRYSMEKTLTGEADYHHANADYGALIYKKIQDFSVD